MSDFYKARLAATYTPLDGEEVALIRHGHLLAEPAGTEWSLQTASYEYIAHTWAGDLPTGNARLTLAAQPLVRANTRAALERKLRHIELQLNLHRTGTLLLEEAYSNGAPTLHTHWTAVIETANATPLPLEEAPPIPGAWGKLDLSIILTNPSLEDPLSRQSSEGAEEDNPNPNPNPENPDNPGSQEDNPGSQEDNPGSQEEQEPQYATGWLYFANGYPPDDIGLYINGTHITTNCGGGGTGQQWADAINAAACGVTAEVRDYPMGYPMIDLTATEQGEAGEVSLELRDGPYKSADQNLDEFLSGPTLTLPAQPGTPRT